MRQAANTAEITGCTFHKHSGGDDEGAPLSVDDEGALLPVGDEVAPLLAPNWTTLLSVKCRNLQISKTLSGDVSCHRSIVEMGIIAPVMA